MARFPEKIIQHLRFAQNWLERAEEEYSKDKILEAELTLSLAEAEVRHAWETSRGLEPSISSRAARTWRKGLIFVLVFSGVILGGYYLYEGQSQGYLGADSVGVQQVFPGNWDNQVEFRLVLQEPAPHKREVVHTPPAALPVIDPVEEVAEPKDTVKQEPEIESSQDNIAAPAKEPVVPEVADSNGATESVTNIVVPEKPETNPALEAPAVDKVKAVPPELNISELFKIASEALKGE